MPPINESDLPANRLAKRQLRSFFLFFDLAVAIFFVLFVAEFWMDGGLKPGFGALYCGLLLGLLCWCHRLLRQGQVKTPILAVFWGILGITVIAAIPPISFATLGMIPVMGLLVALPFLGRKEAWRYLGLAWLVTLLCYGLAFALPTAPVTAFRHVMEILDIFMASGLTLFLVWQLRMKIEQSFEEKHQFEERMGQIQKMESVGRLAGGIAHDFNNLITVVLCNIEFLKQGPVHSPEQREAFDDITRASERAASLTQQLLAFSRQQVLQPKVLELNDHVGSLKGLLRPVMKQNIAFSIVPSSRQLYIKADAHQIDEVILNLAINARDSMPQGGSLVLTIDEEGPCATISLKDSGTGMNAALIEKIFDPFFTTKPLGQGTGLGLPMVKGFVEQSGGSVQVNSQPGEGSEFKIFLPLVDAPLETGAEASVKALPGAKDLILVAEDEEMLLRLTTTMLTQAGYQVLGASSAADLMVLARRSEDRPTLLITDVLMPETKGPELAKNLRQNWSDLKVLFASGYAQDELDFEGHWGPRDHFLQKPFSGPELLEKVKAILGGV